MPKKRCGEACAKIAAEIDRKTGFLCTRNSVIGKMNRLGLSGNRTPTRTKQQIKSRFATAAARLMPPAKPTQMMARPELAAIHDMPPKPNADGEFITVLTARAADCRCIDARFCGRPVIARGFCADHLALYIQPTAKDA